MTDPTDPATPDPALVTKDLGLYPRSVGRSNLG